MEWPYSPREIGIDNGKGPLNITFYTLKLRDNKVQYILLFLIFAKSYYTMMIHKIINMKRYFFFAVGLTLSLFACDNSHDDLYDPTWMREQYNNQWEMQFGEIDPNHTWNMAKQVKANLSIQEDALSEYTFKIYTANPFEDDNAQLLAKTLVKTDAEGYAEVSLIFDMLRSQKKLFIARLDSKNRMAFKFSEIANETIDVAFGYSTYKTRTISSRAGGDFPTIDAPYTEADVNQLLAEATDVSDQLSYNINQIPNALGKITKNTTVDSWLYNWDSNCHPILIIDNGACLSLKNCQNISNATIIVAKGGILDLTDNMCPFEIPTSGNIIVMPNGKIIDESTDSRAASINLSTTLYNAGEICVRKMNIAGYSDIYGHLYNSHENAVVQVGDIDITTPLGIITNWGKIQCENIFGNPGDDWGQGTINNACLLRVTNEIRSACLNQAARTALECNRFVVNGNIYLHENSILRADVFYANQLDVQYVGVSTSFSDLALLSMNYVEYFNDVTFAGNLFFEYGTAEVTSEDISNAATNGSRVTASIGGAPIYINPDSNKDIRDSECTGIGNTPVDNGPTVEDKPQSWTVACEDLGSIGDFDFNDVVFKVSHVSGSGEITVTPLAAGGTMTVNLYHDSQLLGEIHNLLGVDDVTKMINTGLEGEKGFTSSVSESKTLSVSDSFSMSDNMGGFRLEILNGKGRFAAEIQGPVNGDSPQMICVPGDWRWPREWQKISDAYPDFVNWSSNNNVEWYNNSNSDYIY